MSATHKSTHYEQIAVRRVKEMIATREIQGVQLHDREGMNPILLCRVCSQPVPVESAKTDDYGQAIHEMCYIRALSR